MSSWMTSALLGLGLLLVFIGERIFEAGDARKYTSIVGLVVLLAAVAWRAARWAKAKGDARTVERNFLFFGVLSAVSVALYFLQSDAPLLNPPLTQSSPKLAGVLFGLWPSLLATALFPIFFMELSWGAMARAPKVELARVNDAMTSGLGLAFVAIFAFAAQYVAGERDIRKDFSYFRATKAGDATIKLAQSIDEEVKFGIFYPPANEVADKIESYLADLQAASPKIKVERLDYALEPKKAKEYGVSGNGVIVIAKGARKESLYIGTDFEKSRTQLKSLDQDLNKRLLQVAKAKRTIYMTQGHGERGDVTMNASDLRASAEMLKNELKSQNFDVRDLTSAEGLGSAVPKDAAAVFVLGPQQKFSEPEAKALSDYAASGGKLVIAIDTEVAHDFKELLEPLGLKTLATPLANDVAYARKTYTPADRVIIGTKSFSSHPSVTTNSRMGYPIFVISAGALDELEKHDKDLAIDFTVRTEPSTWDDKNGNFNFDAPAETRKAWQIVAAVSKKLKPGATDIANEMRVLVLGDSDALGDEVLQVSKGNAYFILDALKWILGEENLQGVVNQETDVAIIRTRQQDSLWFYGTTFLAPALVVVAGIFMRRKVKAGAPRPQKAPEVKS
jgi:hypothetical protein